MGSPLEDACRATLLFHAGTPWTPAKAREWLALTGTNEASSKVLCTIVRAALQQVEDATRWAGDPTDWRHTAGAEGA